MMQLPFQVARGCCAQFGVQLGVLVAISFSAGALLAVQSVSANEIYKCRGADGKIVFTSSRAACPDAQPHVLKARVQNVIEPKGAPAAARGPARLAPAARSAQPDGLEKMWRRKRSETEQQLRQLDKQIQHSQAMVKGCNRGSEWYRKDDAGIRRHLSCDQVKAEFQKLQQERVELQTYLRSGLEEECRQAGCLPGWVR